MFDFIEFGVVESKMIDPITLQSSAKIRRVAEHNMFKTTCLKPLEYIPYIWIWEDLNPDQADYAIFLVRWDI